MFDFDAKIVVFTKEVCCAKFWFIRSTKRIHLWEFSCPEGSASRWVLHKEVVNFFCTIPHVFDFKNSLKLRNREERVIGPRGGSKILTVLLIFEGHRCGMITMILSRENYLKRNLRSEEIEGENDCKDAKQMPTKWHEREGCGLSLNMSEIFNLGAICNSIRLESIVPEIWILFSDNIILYFFWGWFVADDRGLSKLPLRFVR